MVSMIRGDLDFILAQIKIAEADARSEQILGTLVPNPELPWGLRRVDGSNNNLLPGQGEFGSADQPFPSGLTGTPVNEGDDGMRFGPPIRVNPLDPSSAIIDFGFPNVPPGYIPETAKFQGIGLTAAPGGFLSPNGTFIPANFQPNFLTNNNYGDHDANDPAIVDPRAIQPGDVVDADPRLISNLVVDQTLNNPAAIYKALRDAGLEDDPTTANHELLDAVSEITAAVTALKDARIAANATTTTSAYAQAVTALDELETLAVAADTATGIAGLLGVGTTVVAADVTALANAQASVDALLAKAEQVLSILNGAGVNAPVADKTAVQAYIDTVTYTKSLLDTITIAVGETVSVTDNLSAAAAQTAGNRLDTDAIALGTQIDTSLATISGASATALAELATREAAVRDLIEQYGIAIDNTPGNTDVLKETLFIGNVAPDAGLSSPFNGWMTLFGQFFDHGLDLVAKGGFGTVYIPLQPDDPLFRPGSNSNFMPVTRATLDENGKAINKVTPFVDQNQTYTSNASHQFFLREYELDSSGRPVATGRLLDGAAGGLATWADVKNQALNLLGIELNDFNIHSVPEILVDPYGNFIPGDNGFPQLVRSFGPPLVTAEGSLTTPVRTADGQVSTGHAFLDDIAHNANPGQFDAVAGPGVDMQNEVADSGATESGVDNISVASHVQATGTYDNELLDRHFITGDGRGNENIGLTAVHHVFHAEHNRQVDLIENLILGEAKAAALAVLADPTNAAKQADANDKLAFLNEWLDVAVDLAALQVTGPGELMTATVDWNGERIFQAAKFPTEMQYQHLVFEEFARTVQPFVNVFNDYNAELDAAIVAEFAHTVYRFGHSMLTETIDRLTPDNQQTIGSGGVVGDPNIGLIEAFLNPVEFTANGMTAEEAAGAIARGMTRQLGNEIDEFVTEALRNNLIGLPLDLAAINIARGRETGVPTLNEARAQFYAGSGDTQIKPYNSWAEFAYNLKNPASVINFIAAYGTHDDITSATTMADKRDAATAIVLGGAGAPADRLDFLQARGNWSVDNGNTSLGGLNNVDFWIGGLAEKQMAFGGMLGTTFNFVFEVQLENLQNADRFYYLSRLANLNLTAQLENNKFAEMIARTTDAEHLPGNVFKRMDYQLEVDQTKQLGPDPTGVANGLDPFLGSINGDTKVVRVDPNDPTNTNYLRFIGGEHVVLGGTDQADVLIGDEGDDTFWGDGGDDTIEGGIGNDFVFGGDGNDIITDQFGDDEIRSGGGDDVVSAGQGVNLIITDTGRDFVWAGDDLDEILLGQGDDFGAGGADEDMIIGGEGNDWLESGLDNGLLLGDNGDLIQGLPIKRSVDSPIVGDDVLIATGGNADFDAETGDDIMVGGLGTDRFFGAFGFDWASYKNDPYGVEADMANRQFAPPQIASSPGVILDRYELTEALSGSRHTDFLRGDSIEDLTVGVEAAQTAFNPVNLDNALKDSKVDLIIGLRELLAPANPASTNSVDEAGENFYSKGNILLGGGGSDIIEGRGGNDIIDGDHWLDVQIKVTPSNGDPIFFVDGMAEIQAKLFSGELKVADLEIVRQIKLATGAAADVDVAQYSGRRADYLVEGLDNMVLGGPLAGSSGFAADMDGDGFVSVRHIERDAGGNIIVGGPDPLDDNGGGLDGTDRLKNVERLLFSDITIKANDHANSIATGKVTITEAGGVLTASLTSLTDPATNVADADGFDPANVTFIWQVEQQPGSGIWTNLNRITADEFSPVTGATFTPTGTEVGLNVRAIARFKDDDGAVETVVSDPIGGTVLGAGRPVYNEELAVLGPDLGGTTVDDAILPARSFGILEDSGPFFFTMRDLWLVRAEMGAIDPAFTPGSTLARDTDTPSDQLTIVPGTLTVRERDGNGTVGTVVPVDGAPWLNPDGSPNLDKQFRFTPAANFEGSVIFEFNMTDRINESVPAEATLDVFNLNDAPTAPTNTGNLGTAPAAAGATFTFTEAQLIGNAFDIEGDNLRLVRPDAPGGGEPRPPTVVAELPVGAPPGAVAGTVTDDGNGNFTYTAADGYIGPVILRYEITDGLAIVAATAQLFTANGAPVVTPLARVATEDAFAGVDLRLGAVDPEGATLTVSGVPATVTTNNLVQLINGTDFTVGGGVFQVTAAGVAKFQSLAQGQTDSFVISYQLSDGVSSVTSSLTVTINGLNDAPTAVAETIITNFAVGTAFTVPDWALLANDIDPDAGTVLSVTARGGAAGVTLLGSDVTDTTPAGGSFNYTAGDGTLTSNATVTVQSAGGTITQSYADNFNSAAFNNSTGTAAWTSAWTEINDDGTTAGGQIRIDQGNSNELRFVAGDGGTIQRTVDLAGVTSASLSFDFDRLNNGNNLEAGDNLTVQFAADGINFVTVSTITNASGNAAGVGSINATLTGPFTANAAIRLVVTSLDGGFLGLTPEEVRIDNLAIAATRPIGMNGGAGSQILVGDGANSSFDGGAGNDVILAGGGDDTITQLSTDGRDIVDGGANGTAAGDRYVLNGAAGAETFNIYTRNAWVDAGNSASLLQADTEIVIERNGVVIAELDNIEEITINTLDLAGPPGPPTGGGSDGDTIQVFGNFAETSLNLNTITIIGSGLGETINISSLLSDHRIVFMSRGGADTLIGTLRPQDVIVLPEGVDPAAVTTTTVDGVTTLKVGDTVIMSYQGAPGHVVGADDDVPEDTSGESSGEGSQPDTIPDVVFVGSSSNEAGFGDQGDDRMSGQAGDDVLFGYAGDDNMVGGDGNDELFAGKGADIVSGGNGNDRVFGDNGDDMLLAGAGDDLVDGGAGNDQIWGDQGRDVVRAGGGNDVIFASAGDGNDVYDGGDGIDTADFSAIESKLVVDLEAGLAKSLGTAGSGDDVLRDIENVVGGSNDDTFYANNASNVFEGGGGNDTFVFRTAASAAGDRIEGFAAGDIIKLSDIFGNINASTFVDCGTFTAAGQIRLVYENGDTLVEGNTDADELAEFSIKVADYQVRKEDIV